MIVDAFERDIQNFVNDLTPSVNSAALMLNYGLQLQKQRLSKYGYCMRYDIKKKDGYHSYENANLGDETYNEANYQEVVMLTKAMFCNGQNVSTSTEDVRIYVNVEDLKAGNVDGSEVTNCPNCGAPSTLRALQQGCPYCGTHFEMTDLYPVVTSYFFQINMAMSKEEYKMDSVGGVFKSYKAAFGKLGKLMKEIPSTVAMASDGAMSSKKRFEDIMKQYIPDFSYYHFAGQMMDMFNMILFADYPASLPFVRSDTMDVVAPTLIDYDYKGIGIENDGVYINGKYIIAHVFLYVTAYYATNRGISKSTEKFMATVSRDITRPAKSGFSYTKINCPTCGGVFDAVKSKHCPYCQTPYQLKDEEWFVLDVSRR